MFFSFLMSLVCGRAISFSRAAAQARLPRRNSSIHSDADLGCEQFKAAPVRDILSGLFSLIRRTWRCFLFQNQLWNL